MQQHHVLLMSKRQRATSVQEQGEQRQRLPNILTPTFGDWKIINDSKAHPKISRRNPLFNKFGLMPKKAVTPSSCNHQNESIFRGLRSEEQSQRMKENYEDRVSTTETNNLMVNQFESEKKPFLKIREMEVRTQSVKEQPRQLVIVVCICSQMNVRVYLRIRKEYLRIYCDRIVYIQNIAKLQIKNNN